MDLTFQNLNDNVGVDLNPETIEEYSTELQYLGFVAAFDKYRLYGKYLIVTLDGPDVLEPITFHRIWKFYTPEQADRTKLRTIVRR